MSSEDKYSDTVKFVRGLVMGILDEQKENKTLQKLRYCMERLEAFEPSQRQKIYAAFVGDALGILDSQICKEECQNMGHSYTTWKKVDYIDTDVREDIYGDGRQGICEPWELPDAMKTYIMQQETKERWERRCIRCGQMEYSYVNPSEMALNRKQ